MKTPLGDRVRLQHILDAIEYIEEFMMGRTKQDLYENVMLRSAVERQLEIIGEAANRLNPAIRADRSDIEWQNIVDFRNLIVHEYFGIDLELVWDVVQTKLHSLREATVDLLSRIQ